MLFDELMYRMELDEVVAGFKKEIANIRTGVASKEMFESIMVSAYDTVSPVTNLARLAFKGITVTVSVFDKNLNHVVWEALKNVLQGASVVDKGEMIIINFMPITQEDRIARAKELGKVLEEYKVSTRLIRQDYMQKVKVAESVSEDEQKLAEKDIQEILNEYTESLEKISSDKEMELLQNK